MMQHHCSWQTSSAGNRILMVTDASHSCSHLLSSQIVYGSYRLKFFVGKDHLRDGGSLSQLQSSWLPFTQGSRSTQRAWHGHESRSAEIETESKARGGPTLFITKLMMTYVSFMRYLTRPYRKLGQK